MTFLTALYELGGSSTLPGRWNLTLTKTTPDPKHRGPEHATTERIVLSTGLTKDQAEKLADQLNDFLTDRPTTFDTCEICDSPISQPTTGRPRKYCSAACSQIAYRHRQPTDDSHKPSPAVEKTGCQ